MKKLFLTCLLVALGASRVPAQTATVVALDKSDAQEAKEKWNRLQAAQAEWDKFQERVRQDYVVVSPTSKTAGHIVFGNSIGGGAYRAGFENGFLFSNDFKFIVPKPNQLPSFSNIGACFTPTPAFVPGLITAAPMSISPGLISIR